MFSHYTSHCTPYCGVGAVKIFATSLSVCRQSVQKEKLKKVKSTDVLLECKNNKRIGKEKNCMDSIVTPEHLHALFYGFDNCTMITKKISSSDHHPPSPPLPVKEWRRSSSASDADIACPSISTAFTHPTASITFIFLIMRPLSFSVIYSLCFVSIPGQLLS